MNTIKLLTQLPDNLTKCILELINRGQIYILNTLAMVMFHGVRWMIQHGAVVIPNSAHKERIVENFSIFNCEPSSEDVENIITLDIAQSLFIGHRDPEMVKWLDNLNFDI